MKKVQKIRSASKKFDSWAWVKNDLSESQNWAWQSQMPAYPDGVAIFWKKIKVKNKYLWLNIIFEIEIKM